MSKPGIRRPSPAAKKRHALARQRRVAARRRGRNRSAGQRRRN